MEKLFSGIWWIDALRVWGIAFLLALPTLFVAWWLVDRLRWSRTDAVELVRMSPKPKSKPVKNTLGVTK